MKWKREEILRAETETAPAGDINWKLSLLQDVMPIGSGRPSANQVYNGPMPVENLR
jgi:hypothetical protein